MQCVPVANIIIIKIVIFVSIWISQVYKNEFSLYPLEFIFCEQQSSHGLNVMVEGFLHLPSFIKTWLSLKTTASPLSSEVTFAVILHALWNSENALLNFELSVDLFTTCQLPQCQRSTCHHTLSPTFSLSNHLIPQHSLPYSLHLRGRGTLAHCLSLQRTSHTILES